MLEDRLLRLLTGPFGHSVSFTIRVEVDQVGQEGVEVFEIPLHITSEGLSGPVFVMGSAFVTVTDKSGKLHYTGTCMGCIEVI